MIVDGFAAKTEVYEGKACKEYDDENNADGQDHVVRPEFVSSNTSMRGEWVALLFCSLL